MDAVGKWSIEIHLVRPDGTNANFHKEVFQGFSDAVDWFAVLVEKLGNEPEGRCGLQHP